ncbi:MAG: isochorismatase [Deltaproteobacteria bacterium SG8_13]|nr:MAG: isochorismatase [Deltaproteobacteria bacterium SG8_13]
MAMTAGETPALLVIDMVNDYFDPHARLAITAPAVRIIEPINRLLSVFHQQGWPVVFATDAFQRQDFIFTARMKPHSLAGSEGAQVIAELDRKPQDIWLPKPRFSAFFHTGLEHRLQEKNVTLCAVAGLATHFCVLTTALDALCHDFKAVLLEDCSAAPLESTHERVLETYRRNPLFPLFTVATSAELIKELTGGES